MSKKLSTVINNTYLALIESFEQSGDARDFKAGL